MTAGEALQAVAAAAVDAIDGLSVHEGQPVQAVVPFAVVEAGPETDWSHKSGEGREVRLAVTLRDAGERPVRLRRLMGEAEAAVGGIAGVAGWRLVTMRFVRSRVVAEARGRWAGVIEYRARLLRE